MNERLTTSSSMLDRLLFLSDGVFAIAITLLVLEIALPHVSGSDQTEERAFPGALWAVWPQVLTYALTFLIVGVYWMSHQRMFEYLVRADSVLAWLNVFFLMSVAFLPIPSKILGEYGALGAAVRFYALCLMVPGLLIIVLWWYATADHRLVVKDLDAGIIRHRLERYFIAPMVFVLAIGLSYINPHIAGVTLLLVVVGVAAHEVWHRLRMARGTNKT
jgi:TMEM175 potassium channel family protein